MPGLTDVAHVDALDGYGLLSGVSYASAPQAASNYKVNSLEMQANTFPLDALEVMDPLLGLKRAKYIAAYTPFSSWAHMLGGSDVYLCSKTSPLLNDYNVGDASQRFASYLGRERYAPDLQGVLHTHSSRV